MCLLLQTKKDNAVVSDTGLCTCSPWRVDSLIHRWQLSKLLNVCQEALDHGVKASVRDGVPLGRCRQDIRRREQQCYLVERNSWLEWQQRWAAQLHHCIKPSVRDGMSLGHCWHIRKQKTNIADCRIGCSGTV
jgi:hypothetical protein